MNKGKNQEPRIKDQGASKKTVSSKRLEGKINELTSDLQRVHADFVNYRRRSEEEHSQVMAIAKKEVVMKFLPVLDDAQRALEHLPANSKPDPISQGYKMICSQLEQTLKGLGVEEIEAMDQVFDPQLHEAVDFQDGQGEHEVVTEVLKAGYHIAELVLRPSVVRVGKTSNKSKKEDK